MKAYELIADESKFCRGNYAVDASHNYTNPAINSHTGECRAVKWDLIGAIQHCYSMGKAMGLLKRAREKLQQINLGRTKDKFTNLAQFNDSVAHAEVIKLLQGIEE